MKKKQLLAICILVAMLLTCLIPVQADEDYDALAVAAGYHARVGEAADAYDNGNFTGYRKFNEDLSAKGGRDNALKELPEGAVVTLISDVTITTELYMVGQFTLDGNGKTLTGSLRVETKGTDVTVRNLNVVYNKPASASLGRYLMQIENTATVTFENCNFAVTATPDYGLCVMRGNINMNNCVLNWSGNIADSKYVFYMDTAGAKLVLRDTKITIPSTPEKLGIIACYWEPSQNTFIELWGDTVLTSAPNRALVAVRRTPSVIMESTVVTSGINPENLAVKKYDVWDGTADTSWFDKNDPKTSYELDTAEKLAGLAKLVNESGTADQPFGKDITFNVTANMELGGKAWTPIGNSNDARFGGKLIGKIGTDRDPAIISGLNIAGAGSVAAFAGVTDSGAGISNFIFQSPTVTGNAQTAAVVCGYARSGGKFSNITVQNATLQVTDAENVGGLCGYSELESDSFVNCIFTGDINVTGAAGKNGSVGGMIGSSAKGAEMEKCFVSGSIVVNGATVSTGGLAGTLGADLTAVDCQVDSFIKNIDAAADATGALIGNAVAGETATNVTLTRVFVSGLSLGSGANTAAGYAWIGKLSGSAKLTADGCVALAKLALYGNKAEAAALTGGDTGITVCTLADANTALVFSGWSSRDGMHTVLAIAKDLARTANANAEYSWFDFASDSAEISNFNQLVGFSVLSKLYDFGGKTITLTDDIDGSQKLAGQTLAAGGSFNESVSTAFRGSFDKNGHGINNVDFELGAVGKYIVSWVVNDTRTNEEYDFGEIPTFKGDTTRPDDEVYRYVFNGWDKEPEAVTADVIYTARWKKTKLSDLAAADNKPSDVTGEQTDNAGTDDSGKKGGCKSSVSFGILPLVLIPAVLVIASVACNDEKKRSIR